MRCGYKYPYSTICFGEDTAPCVTNKANSSQIPCTEVNTVLAKGTGCPRFIQLRLPQTQHFWGMKNNK